MKYALALLIGLTMLPLYAGDDPMPRYTVNVNGKLPRNVLSNEGIVLLSDAGYDEDFLADLIVHKQTHFDTTVEGLAYLANHGISERIIRFMIANESKSAGPLARVEAAVAPAIVPARVVYQKVLVPDMKARPRQAAPAVYPGAIYAAAPVPSAYPSQPAATAPYGMVESHLFGNRWYIVSPSYTQVAVPMPQFPQSAIQRASYFPVW